MGGCSASCSSGIDHRRRVCEASRRKCAGNRNLAACATLSPRGIEVRMKRSTYRSAALGTLLACVAAARSLQTPAALAEAPPETTSTSREKVLAARVDPARAQQRVRDLVALGPRMGGTRSGDAAAAYTAKAMRASGLDARVVDDPEKSAYQPLHWRVVAHTSSKPDEPFELTHAWPWVHSPDAKGRAELSLDSRQGAVWLTDRRMRGASNAALVLVDGVVTIDGEHPVVTSLRPGAAQACIGISRGEGKLLRDELASGARVEIEYELVGEARTAPPKTVLARLRGANSPAGEDAPWADSYFLFCAHGDSDSGGPGADDNASGVATVIEIASAWKAAIDAHEAPPPAREVRFAVWGSEIYSTNDYVKTRLASEGRCLGVVNYDQSGFGSGADQLNIEPDDLPANRAFVETLLAVLKDHAPADATTPGAFPAHWATNKSLGGTDSYVFSGTESFAANDTPSLTVYTSAWGAPAEHKRTKDMPGESWRDREKVSVDYDAFYHSAGDTPENTTDKEPWNMAWCARVGMLAALRYVDALAAAEAGK